MKTLKIGILGESPGNGHPYSWSAIFNGYDAISMASCPYPVIPEYLSHHVFPRDQIKGARVTHIWTQDEKVSEKIAKATRISTIVREYEDMVGKVDAVLLARDDAENHMEMAKPFLLAGIPIYIDKPLAFDAKTAKQLFQLAQYPEQIFSCSPLAYAAELDAAKTELATIGSIRHISAVVGKDWNHYAMHIIDPVIRIIPSIQLSNVTPMNHLTFNDQQVLTVSAGTTLLQFSTLGSISTPVKIQVFGETGSLTITVTDVFSAFKNTLSAFIDQIKNERNEQKQMIILKSVEILEMGAL